MKVLDFGLAKAIDEAMRRASDRVEVADDDAPARPAWRDPGHRRLHGAGAGARQDGRRARRRLGVRRRAVRDAHGQHAVPGRANHRGAGDRTSKSSPTGSTLPATCRRACGCSSAASRRTRSCGCTISATRGLALDGAFKTMAAPGCCSSVSSCATPQCSVARRRCRATTLIDVRADLVRHPSRRRSP